MHICMLFNSNTGLFTPTITIVCRRRCWQTTRQLSRAKCLYLSPILGTVVAYVSGLLHPDNPPWKCRQFAGVAAGRRWVNRVTRGPPHPLLQWRSLSWRPWRHLPRNPVFFPMFHPENSYDLQASLLADDGSIVTRQVPCILFSGVGFKGAFLIQKKKVELTSAMAANADVIVSGRFKDAQGQAGVKSLAVSDLSAVEDGFLASHLAGEETAVPTYSQRCGAPGSQCTSVSQCTIAKLFSAKAFLGFGKRSVPQMDKVGSAFSRCSIRVRRGSSVVHVAAVRLKD